MRGYPAQVHLTYKQLGVTGLRSFGSILEGLRKEPETNYPRNYMYRRYSMKDVIKIRLLLFRNKVYRVWISGKIGILKMYSWYLSQRIKIQQKFEK